MVSTTRRKAAKHFTYYEVDDCVTAALAVADGVS
jgi:hypothetical protein